MKAICLCLSLMALSAPELAFARTGIGYVVCNLNPNGDNFLALRAGPSSGSQMLMKLGPGTRVLTWARRGNWVNVTVGSGEATAPSGWVFDRYICRTEY